MRSWQDSAPRKPLTRRWPPVIAALRYDQDRAVAEIGSFMNDAG
jgi:hypothetical protein